MKRKLKKWELGYLAGLVDSEFHVSFQRTEYKTKTGKIVPGFYTVLNMSMANDKIINFVHELFPNTLVRKNRKLPGHLPTKRVIFNVQDRLPVLKSILPYMQGRKEQVKLMIQYEELKNKYLYDRSHKGHKSYAPKSEVFIRKAEILYNKFRVLQLIRKGRFKDY